MTVRAPDSAQRDLLEKPRLSAAATREVENTRRLAGNHVVEIEDTKVPKSAVRAAGPRECLVGEQDVALFGPRPAAVRSPIRTGTPPTAPAGRPPPVTVHADHLAGGQLGFKRFDGHTVSHQGADVLSLGPYMVEFQDHRIALSAIGARSRLEVSKQNAASLDLTPECRGPNLLPVNQTTTSEVVTEAVATPGLAATRMAVELGDRTPSVAASAAA